MTTTVVEATAADAARPVPGAGEVDEAQIWKEMEADEAKAAGKPDAGETAAAAAFEAAASGTAEISTTATTPPADKAGEATTTDAKDKDAAAAQQPPAGAEGAKTTDKPDIWADATPELKAAHEAVSKDFDQYKRSNEGRIAALQRQVDTLKKGRAAGQPAARDEKPAEKIDPLKLIQEDPDFQLLEKELPEVAGPVGKILARMADRLGQPLDSVREKVSTIEAERTEAYLEAQDMFVREKHEDYDDITKSPEFGNWYATAPAYLKAGVERNARQIVDGHEVADIVSRFKSDTGWKRPASAAGEKPADPTTAAPPPVSDKAPPAQDPDAVRRDLQIKSSISPKTTGGAQVAKPPSDDPGEIWKEFDEQDRREAASR